MELYIKVSFWIGVVCLMVRLGNMGTTKWPKTETKTLGSYVGETLLQIIFLAWAGIVLWVAN